MDTISKLETYYGKDSWVRDTFEGYNPELAEALLKYTELAHTEGVFHLVADSEAVDTPMASPEAMALSYALQATGKDFQEGGSEYIIGSYGPGWIVWGIGCVMASASCAMFVDDSHYVGV